MGLELLEELENCFAEQGFLGFRVLWFFEDYILQMGSGVLFWLLKLAEFIIWNTTWISLQEHERKGLGFRVLFSIFGRDCIWDPYALFFAYLFPWMWRNFFNLHWLYLLTWLGKWIMHFFLDSMKCDCLRIIYYKISGCFFFSILWCSWSGNHP
jgi:hypothetical protein